MAYSNANLKLLIPGMGATGQAVYAYRSTDAHGTVEGSGYFDDGVDFGMKVGDIVFVTDSDDGATTVHSVTVANATTKAVTINAATLA